MHTTSNFRIRKQDTKILSTKPCYMDWLIKEATEIKFQPNMNLMQSFPALTEQRWPLQYG
jgi:hypothetical protein